MIRLGYGEMVKEGAGKSTVSPKFLAENIGRQVEESRKEVWDMQQFRKVKRTHFLIK